MGGAALIVLGKEGVSAWVGQLGGFSKFDFSVNFRNSD